MDDSDLHIVCGKCEKRLPDEMETERILQARRTIGQEALENLARKLEFDFCVCLGFQTDTPESICEVPTRTERVLSYEEQKSFQIAERARGLDPRVDRPLWHNDDIATRLVLLLQCPPEEFDEMYQLIRKHWRGTTPMKDRRRDMLELRKRGEKVFGEAMWMRKLGEYAYPSITEQERLAAGEGWFYLRKDASNTIAECFLPLLKREGSILPWRSWNFLRLKPVGARRQRYKMDRTIPEWISLSEKIEALFEELKHNPSDFQFMDKLLPSELAEVPASRWQLLLKILRELWECPLRGLFSFPYLFYVFRTRLGNFMRFLDKRFLNMGTIAALVLMSLAIYAGSLWFSMSFFHLHTDIVTMCLMLPISVWTSLLINVVTAAPNGRWLGLFR